MTHVLLAFCFAALSGGCAALPRSAPKPSPGRLGARDAPASVARSELDELTRAFADRYVGLLSSTCDALKKDNPNPVQRREVQELMLDGATNVYDIASNPDAFTRMLDLVVVTTLVSQVWIDDDRAGDVFGDRGEVLVRALHHGRVEAWALAAQVLRPDQLDLLDSLLWNWRRQNPDMVRVSFVRFSNFALARGKSADAEVVAAGGFFAPVGDASKAVDEARLLSERVFYLLKREPTLLRWQVQAIQDETLANPMLTTALADVHRLTDQAEQLPKNIAAERVATLAAIDARKQGLDETLTNVRGAITDVNGAADSLSKMLKTADSAFTRFDAWDRWSVSQPQHRPFDIREYTTGVKELTGSLEQMNDVIHSSNDLLASAEWGRRIGDVNQSADGRVRTVAQQSQLLIDTFYRRLYLAMGAFFAMLVLYRVTSLLLTRRLGIRGQSAAGPKQGNGHERSSSGTVHRPSRKETPG